MGGCGAVAGIAHKALITLRNAQVRRISWVRGVRPVRGRYEWPPHDAAPDRPPLSRLIANPRRVRRNAKGALHPGRFYASYDRVGYLILGSLNSTCFLS